MNTITLDQLGATLLEQRVLRLEPEEILEDRACGECAIPLTPPRMRPVGNGLPGIQVLDAIRENA